MRVSQKSLQNAEKFVNSHVFKNGVKHKVSLCFTQGCGVYAIIDGKEYNHLRKDGSYEGISNKNVWKLLKPFYDEALEQYQENKSK